MLQSIGMAAVALGILGIVWGIFQKVKAGRVADAPLVPTGDVARRGREVAGPKGQISAQGNVVCRTPLVAPFSGTPCLFYSIRCTAEWKELEETKSKVLHEEKVAADFVVDDGSGGVAIDAREGGDFEPTQTKRETKSTGLLGGLAGTALMFGNYRVQTGMLSLGTKYTVQEEVMPVVPRVYACGRVADAGGAITAPSWRSLILSQKSREELLAAATKGAKTFLLAGAVAVALGGGLTTLGALSAQASRDEAPLAGSEAFSITTTVAATGTVPPPTSKVAGKEGKPWPATTPSAKPSSAPPAAVQRSKQ